MALVRIPNTLISEKHDTSIAKETANVVNVPELSTGGYFGYYGRSDAICAGRYFAGRARHCHNQSHSSECISWLEGLSNNLTILFGSDSVFSTA